MIVFVLLFLVSISNRLHAQTATSGGLAGVVTDPSDAVIPNAQVEIRDIAKGLTQTTHTDDDGGYQFSFLAPSSYTLVVTHAGFKTENRAVDVLLGPPGTMNVRLKIARTNTTVTVTEEAPLVQAENGDVSTTMNQRQISEVPNPGGDLTYIAQTAPGAVMNTEIGSDGSFSILGMPATSNLFTLNGMNINNMAYGTNVSGALNMLLGQNQVQEATVVSNGYSGQFGSVAGSNINYITKSGSNEFHGNAVYFWNGRAFNANDWIFRANGIPRPFDTANQWAGSFGGPIKSDKLFFFFNTEGLRILIPQGFFVVLPSKQFEEATIANIDSRFGPSSASDAFYKQIFNLYNGTHGANAATPGTFTNPLGCSGFVGPNGLGTTLPCAVHFFATIGLTSDQSLVSGRVDWNVGGNDRAFLLIQYDHGFQASYTDPINPLFNVGSSQPDWEGQFIETHAFGNSAANQFILAGWLQEAFFEPASFTKTLAAFPTVLNWNPTGLFTNLGGFDNFYPQGINTTQYSIADDVVKAAGRHKLGFGVNFDRADWTERVTFQNAIGVLNVQTLDAFYQGGVDPASPNQNFTQLMQSFSKTPTQRIAFYDLGFYAEDEWHARANLTLTLAFRAEHQSNPVCQNRCFAQLAGTFESISHDPSQPYNQVILTNQKQAFRGMDPVLWMPRFSFAWQPFGVSHNTVVRGGAGIFYDAVARILVNNFSANPPLYNSFTISSGNIAPGETTSLFKDAAASNAAFVNGFAAGENLAQIQAADPNFSPPGITVSQQRTHAPQYQKWSLELQQAFGPNTSINIGYYGYHGLHEVIQNPSANAFGFGSFPATQCTSPPVLPCSDPRFSQVTELGNPGVSNYNGMVISFQHRFTRWTQGFFQANYTYSHALDEVSNGGVLLFSFGSFIDPQDPNNIREAYGPANYDVRHSFNANYVWQVPLKAALRGHGSDYLVNGWQVSGTIFARTGFPYTVFDFAPLAGLAKLNYFGLIYAVPVSPNISGGSCGIGAAIRTGVIPNPCLPPEVLANSMPNPDALFVQPGCETNFNMGTLPGPTGPCGGTSVSFAQGRNHFRGPHYFDTDFAIMKNTKIPGWDKGVLGIGFQFFNFFNHPNFQLPDHSISDATFGDLVSTAGPPTSILGASLGGDVSPRMIQLKVQLQF